MTDILKVFIYLFISILISACFHEESGTDILIRDVGVVEGLVKDSNTGNPIASATLKIGDDVTESRSNGTYTFEGIQIGSRTITAQFDGYTFSSGTVEVEKGKSTNFNFELNKTSTAVKNSAPVTSSASFSVDEDNVITLDLPITNIENDNLTFFLEASPLHGTIQGTYPNLVYKPNKNYFGVDELKYKVSDGQYDSNIAIISITVNPINDPPNISGVPASSIKSGDLYSFTPTAFDVEKDSLVFSINTLPGWANFSSSTGSLTGTPSNSDAGNIEDIVISVSDNASSHALTAFSLNIKYNPWSRKSPMPTGGRLSPSLASSGTKLFATGGQTNQNFALTLLETYDVLEESWSTKEPMSVGRNRHTSHVINNELFVIGGYSISYTSTDSIEAYDISTDSWTSKSPMIFSRLSHASCLHDDNIYVFGGYSSGEGNLSSVEMYDPINDTWTLKASMVAPNKNMSCTTINDSIYVFGGSGGNYTTLGGPNSSKYQIYKPISDTWEEGGPLRPSRGHGFESTEIDGLIYMFGALPNEPDVIAVEVLNLSIPAWSSKTSINSKGARIGGFTIMNGVIYIVGAGESYNELLVYEAFMD